MRCRAPCPAASPRATGAAAATDSANCLGGGRRQAAHPGGLDLLDPLGLRGAALAFELGMPGHDPSFTAPTRDASGRACTRRAAGRRPTGAARRLSLAGEPVRSAETRANLIGSRSCRRVRRLGRRRLGGDDGARHPRRRRRGRRDLRCRPAVRLPGTPPAARDRRRAPDRADLAGAGPAPDAARGARPARARRPRARLPLARVHRRRHRPGGRLGVVQWISLGRDPGGRAAHAPGPDHRHRGVARAASRRDPGRPGRDAARALGARLRPRDRDRGAGIPALGYFAQVPHYVSGPYATAASSCSARSAITSAARIRHASWRTRRPSCGRGSTRRPASTETTRSTSSGSRRCTTSSACRRATTSSPTSSGSCATRAGAPRGVDRRSGAQRGRPYPSFATRLRRSARTARAVPAIGAAFYHRRPQSQCEAPP